MKKQWWRWNIYIRNWRTRIFVQIMIIVCIIYKITFHFIFIIFFERKFCSKAQISEREFSADWWCKIGFWGMIEFFCECRWFFKNTLNIDMRSESTLHHIIIEISSHEIEQIRFSSSSFIVDLTIMKNQQRNHRDGVNANETF